MAARPHLCFRQTECLRQLFPLGADDIVVLLERVFQFQELTRTECGAYPLGLSEGLKKEAGDVRAWNQRNGFNGLIFFNGLYSFCKKENESIIILQ